MHSFYIEPAGGGTIWQAGELARLPLDEAKHAAKVLRLSDGDEVCAMDGVGHRWRGEIETGAEGMGVRLVEALPSNEAPVRVTLYEGLPKADKLEWIAQKLTELGACELAPVRMERCVVRLDGKDAEKRRERLDRIAREAAKQCGRALPLHVEAAMDWRAALRAMARHDLLLIPWEDARGRRLRDVYEARPDARDIGVVIGPEGGITPQEVAAMAEIGGVTVTLGPRILRTETAAVVSAALVMQLWGDG